MRSPLLTALMMCGLLACDSEPTSSPPAAAPSTEAAPAATPAVAATPPTEMVEVAATGSQFDPPVGKEQVPEGAWICDMGTVHYAAMDKPEGGCPLCGMDLVQNGGGEGAAH